jgi:hypothetical protein
MIFKLIALTALLFVFSNQIFSQPVNGLDKFEIKNKILNSDTDNPGLNKIAQSKKNPGLAMLLSFVLPGAGHYYVNRMDVGKYFVVAEATSWLGVLGLNIYGDAVRDDSRKFAVEHARINNQGKDDEYYANVGNYNNVYEYNDDKLRRGEYDKLYEVNSFFWNWDDINNRDSFENQRRSSERIYNSRIIFGSALIVNRIVSGVSALILANSVNSRSSSSLYLDPRLTYDNDLRIDGFRLNVIGNLNF